MTLLAPEVNAHGLIRDATGVITISSDVGWEALAYGKPVIVLARPWWAYRGVSLDCPDWAALPAHLETVLRSDYRPDHERYLKLVHAMYESVQPLSGGGYSYACPDAPRVIDRMLEVYAAVRSRETPADHSLTEKS